MVFTCSDGSPVYYYNVNSAINDYVAKINVIEIELAKEEKKKEEVAELKILLKKIGVKME